MNKWKALAVAGIWIGVGLASIGAGMAGAAAFINFPVLPISAAVATWLVAGQRNS